jgi:hypothetical protein
LPTPIFDPVGLLGRAYWYGIYPLHALVFKGLLNAITKRVSDHDDSRPTGLNDTAA